ncbi:MAG: endopeptidase La, partial [Clostridia bacterium]|nr:endopeptidase La [Clostridia bacterium]
MPSFVERIEEITLPVINMRDTVSFPALPINFDVTGEAANAAVAKASDSNALLFLVASSKADEQEETDGDGLYRVGTIVKIKQMLRSPDRPIRLVAEGLTRAAVKKYKKTDDLLEAELMCKQIILPDHGGVRGEACMRMLLEALEDMLSLLPKGGKGLIEAARMIEEPGELSDFIASTVITRTADKQSVLECFDPLNRAELLLHLLDEEAELRETEAEIRFRVDERMNRNQREYYLREQIKVIQEELGEGSDTEEFAKRIRASSLPAEVEAKLLRENEKLAKIPYGSAEATVLSNYIDTCLEIPWGKTTRDRVRFSTVQKVLDADHTGLEKVKERIVEYIAAKQFSPELRNQIICLVGPPGVGKTSIASSIAKAMNRKYVRISLGGIRDEADIRGHRKTYSGARPGRLITAVTQAGVSNPLILLDEIDKLTRDTHGDPTSALLEVLDAEQNKNFRDHFVELPFDLSHCMFLATANSLDSIPRPLLDRMEIIELGIYTKREKLAIAKNHLIPKQLKRHGMNKKMLTVTDGAVTEIIDYYTREAGVRTLERKLATLCRKAGKHFLETETRRLVIDTEDVKTYLGVRKCLPESIEEQDEIGTVNGLAYTELGGTLLRVEVAILDGTGKIETTGSLGDVMKESAQIAVSYVRSVAKQYGIPTDFYKTKDIHIHFPEGATPKDGPSAGVTMVTALISALTGRPVRRDIAMTGEVSLRGKALAIGGLKEKTMAAYTAGVRTVFIPQDNLRDLEEIDPLARESMTFVPCRHVEEILSRALVE